MLGYQIGELREPRFIEAPTMLKTTVVPRTWRQRLFSWPWRPWVLTTTATIPDPDLKFNRLTLTYYGHPATIREFRRVWEANGLRRDS